MSRKRNLPESLIEIELQNDKDSDVNDVESLIEDLIDDYRELIAEMDSVENVSQEQEVSMERGSDFLPLEPVQPEVIHPVRGRSRCVRGRRPGSRSRRQTGRVFNCTRFKFHHFAYYGRTKWTVLNSERTST